RGRLRQRVERAHRGRAIDLPRWLHHSPQRACARVRRRNRSLGKRAGGAAGRGTHQGIEMNAVSKTLASNSARKMNGGQALAEMLKASGVGPMFGMGGFQLLPFYEAMRALGLRHV